MIHPTKRVLSFLSGLVFATKTLSDFKSDSAAGQPHRHKFRACLQLCRAMGAGMLIGADLGMYLYIKDTKVARENSLRLTVLRKPLLHRHPDSPES